MHGDYAGFEAAVGVPQQPAQERVNGIGMERRQRVGGVRLEPEQLAATMRPRRARRVVLRRTQCMRDNAAVAEAVEHRFPLVEFDAADEMGVVAEHHVRACLDGGLRDRALVGRKPCRGVHDALVERDDHELGAVACRCDVCPQHRVGISGGQRQRRVWRDRDAAFGLDAQVSAAGTLVRGPARLGSHTVVAQHGDAPRPTANQRGLPGGGKVAARTRMRDTQPVQFGHGVLDALRTTIGHVVAREGHSSETGAFHRRQVRGVSARRRHIARQFRATSRVRHFKVTDGHIGSLHGRPDARQPVISVRDVEHQIARQHQTDGIL